MAMAGDIDEISDKFGIELKQKQREDLHMTPSTVQLTMNRLGSVSLPLSLYFL